LPNFDMAYSTYTGTGLCLMSTESVGIAAPLTLSNWWDTTPPTSRLYYPAGSSCSGTPVFKPIDGVAQPGMSSNGRTYWSIHASGSDGKIYYARGPLVDLSDYKSGFKVDEFTRLPNGTSSCYQVDYYQDFGLQAEDSGYSVEEFFSLWPWTLRVR